MRLVLALLHTLFVALLTGCGTTSGRRPASWPRYRLESVETWQLNRPNGERFDASGLFLAPNGDLLTVNDRGPAVYRIQFKTNATALDLVKLPGCFTTEQLARFAAEKQGHYDCEGITEDSRGRIYLCEEENRWILRCDPRSDRVERLNIDWSPVQKYFSAADSN